ncbi:MAG: sporulation protein YqfD [Syntrophomonadaceae bacterium]|nr:sporulation protein YqfD [Syntrophomonadaceae bacterium]
MADNRIFELLSGTVSLTVKTDRPEQLLNLAMARGIHIWSIRYSTQGVSLKLRISAFDALSSLAGEYGLELEVHGIGGMPLYRRVARQRLGFIAGLAFFVLALWLMSSSVWSIAVTGNEQVGEARIITCAARHGLSRGVMRWEFERKEVEDDILRDIPELAYVEIRLTGVRAEIKVVEKVLPDEDQRSPAHVVARRDGVIAEVLTLAGSPQVKAGDTVVAGQVLISGIVLPPVSPYAADAGRPLKTEAQLTHARGVIKARVWYEADGECARRQEEHYLTGEKQRRLYLVNNDTRYWLWGRKQERFAYAQSASRSFDLPFSGGNWQVQQVCEEELRAVVNELNEREAFEVARELAIDELRQYCGEAAEVRNSWIDLLSEPDADIVRVRLVMEVMEDIGAVQLISE